MRNRDLLFLALTGFGAYWGNWGFVYWANALMILGFHLSVVEAGFAMALFGTGCIIGKASSGFLSDRMGGKRRQLGMSYLLVFTALLLVFGHLHGIRSFTLVAPFLGLFATALTPLIAYLIVRSAGDSLAGSATGLTNVLWQQGNIVVPLIIGAVYARTHSFRAAFFILAAGPLFGAIMLFCVNEKKIEAKSLLSQLAKIRLSPAENTRHKLPHPPLHKAGWPLQHRLSL